MGRDTFKKGGQLREGTLVRYRFIARRQLIWPMSTICLMLAVSRAEFNE